VFGLEGVQEILENKFGKRLEEATRAIASLDKKIDRLIIALEDNTRSRKG
jgi:hypothetical protein